MFLDLCFIIILSIHYFLIYYHYEALSIFDRSSIIIYFHSIHHHQSIYSSYQLLSPFYQQPWYSMLFSHWVFLMLGYHMLSLLILLSTFYCSNTPLVVLRGCDCHARLLLLVFAWGGVLKWNFSFFQAHNNICSITMTCSDNGFLSINRAISLFNK